MLKLTLKFAELLYRRANLKNFTKFLEKQLCWNHFVVKLQLHAVVLNFMSGNFEKFFYAASFQNISFPGNIYLFKVNNRNTRRGCEICSNLTIKTPEYRSGVFIVNFEHMSNLFLVCLLLTLNY